MAARSKSSVPVVAQRARAYAELLAELGGEAAKADLRQRIGVDGNQAAAAIGELKRHGHVTETDRNRRLVLTAEGWATVAPISTGKPGGILVPVVEGVDAELGRMAPRVAAFLRLSVLALVARPHLDGAAPRLGLVVIGGSGTGKTSIGRYLAEWRGLDGEVLVNLGDVTDNPSGRREQSGGGWTYVPASWTSLPFVIFDEWQAASDGARKDVKAAAFADVIPFYREGARVAMYAVPLLTAQVDGRSDRLKDAKLTDATGAAIRRRSVVLDLGPSTAASRRLGEVLGRAASRLGASDRLPTGVELPDLGALPDLAVVGERFLDYDNGAQLPAPETLRPLVAARIALTDEPTPLALGSVVADFLAVAESVPGQVLPGWPQAFRQALANPALSTYGTHETSRTQLVAALDAAEAEQQRSAARLAESVTAAARADDATKEAADKLAAECRIARDALDGRTLRALRATASDRATADALRKALGRIADTAAHVTTPAGMAQAAARAHGTPTDPGPLVRARGLAMHLATERDTRLREAQAQREQIAAEKRRTQQWARDQRAAQAAAARGRKHQARSELAYVRATARELERHYLRPDGTTDPAPFDVLRKGIALPDGTQRPLIAFVAQRGDGVGLRVLAALASQTLPTGSWRATWAGGSQYGWAGTAVGCPVLDKWGPAARAALAPVLAELHALEDARVAELGTQPRDRPKISDSQTGLQNRPRRLPLIARTGTRQG